MNKFLLRFAIKNVKDHKKIMILLFAIITFIAVLIISITGYNRLIPHNQLLDNIKQYGGYYFAIDNATHTQQEHYRRVPFLPAHSETYQYGTYNNIHIGYLGEDYSLLPITLESGSLPINNNEIAIEKDYLLQNGYSLELGQIIDIDYLLNDGVTLVHETFILSGVINDYSNSMLTSSLQAITSAKDYPTRVNFYYITSSKDSIDNSENCLRNEFVFPTKTGTYFATYMNEQYMILGIILIGSMIIMNVLDSITITKQKEMMLLRATGATKMQIVNMTMIQSLFIMLLAIPTALVIGVINLFVISNIMHLTFYFDIETCVTSFVAILLMIVLGSLTPATKAANASITGNLSVKKSHLKIKHSFKMTPLHIATRHMRLNKGQNIFLIAIIVLILSYFTVNIRSYLSNQNYLTDYFQTSTHDFYIEARNLNNMSLGISQEYYETVQKMEGIISAHLIEKVSTDFKLDMNNAYWEKEDVKLRPIIINNISTEILNTFNVDDEQFFRGEVVIIYLPTLYKSENYLASFKDETKNWKEVKEERIKVGDEFTVNDKTFTIGAIIYTTEDLNLLVGAYYYTNPYQIFVSDQFFVNSKLQIESERILINIDKKMDNKAFEVRLKTINQKFNTSTIITNIISERELINARQIKTYNEKIIYGIIALVVLILILFQQSSTRVQTRCREIGIYQALGMDKSKIYRSIVYESILIGVSSILLTIIFQLLGTMLDYNKGFDYALSTLLSNNIGIYLMLLYGVVLTLLILTYHFPIHKILKQKMIKNIQFKE